jgi:hypothetical protein
MTDQLRARLTELKRDYELGTGQLRQLTQQEAALRETLLRISGAIQVLEELVAAAPVDVPPAPGTAASDDNGAGARQTLTVP